MIAPLLAALLLAPTTRPATPDYGWTYDPLYRTTTGWDDDWLKTVRGAPPDLFQVRPVAGVGIDPIEDRHDNFGSATATVVPHEDALHGQRVVVAAFVGRYHWRFPATPDDPAKDQGRGSTAFVKHSDDGGHTWSEGVKLDKDLGFDPFDSDDPRRPKVYMKAIGTGDDGTLHLALGRGVGLLASDDGGDSWTRVVGGLTERQLGDDSIGLGSRLVDHPAAGLLMFGHRGDTPAELRSLKILNSTDGGQTWTLTELDTGDPAVQPVEPTAVHYDGDQVLLFGRNGPNGRSHRPFQLRLKVNGPGDYEVLDARLTNIHATENPDSHEIILNPKNDRFEAVVHNRGGRAPGVNDEGMSTTLWSIAKADLENGSAEWRYDGALNVMQGNYGPAIRPDLPFDLDLWQDGSHPAAGALIDEDGDGTPDRQLIFVQMAASTDSFAHIYVLDRTLDTAALRDYLLPRSPTPFDPRTPVMVASAETPPTIDGEVDDAAWQADPYVTPMRQFIEWPKPRTPATDQGRDLSATFQLAADADALYVLANVRDDRVVPPPDEVFGGDSIELFLSALPPAEADPKYGNRSNQIALPAALTHRPTLVHGGDPAAIDHAFRRTSDGYAVELRVPWHLIGGRPDGRFGFELHVNDRDEVHGDRERKAAWRSTDNTSWQSPRNLGVAELADD